MPTWVGVCISCLSRDVGARVEVSMRYFHFCPITSVKTAKDGEQASAFFHTQSCDRHKETNSSSDSDMFLTVHSFHISSPVLGASVLQLCYISVSYDKSQFGLRSQNLLCFTAQNHQLIGGTHVKS